MTDPDKAPLDDMTRYMWTLRRLSRRRRFALVAISALLLGGLGYGGYLWHDWQRYVSTDDAFVTGHIAPMGARVSGTVVQVLVDDNQEVKAGDLLVRLDPGDYEVAREQARAGVETARGELQHAAVNVPLTDETTQSLVHQAEAALAAAEEGGEIAARDLDARRSGLRATRAAVAAAEAGMRAADADFERARLDRDRMGQLLKAQLVAQQDFDHAEAVFKNAQAMLDAARQRLDQAREEGFRAEAVLQAQAAVLAQAERRVNESRASLAKARSQRQEVKLRQAQVEAARGRLAQAAASLQQAELNLTYTTIRAPLSGRVTKKTVEVGQVVQAGQPLLSIVDLTDVWVVANYKETELTYVRPGQRATITVDSYPGVVFKARVDSIQSGSGAVFSLLPPENATGNFVKVVQRVPVKLVFEPGENSRHRLVPGMSVVPTIEIR